ncbi:MAG: DUF177 domain-containing protein [Caldimonas sp.]
MNARAFEPTRLDIEAFAAQGAELDGRWPLLQFDRLCQATAAESSPIESDTVDWHARGEQARSSRGEPQAWLNLEASTTVALECQRCLAPVQIALDVRRRFRFVHGEDAAAQLDAASEEDVLALTRALDLRELIEEELLLALPIVPAHPVCPAPLPVAPNDEAAEERAHPFAALAALKQDGPSN